MKLHFIGMADGLKPLFILQGCLSNPFIQQHDICYLTEKSEGVAVEFCEKSNIEVIVVEANNMQNSIEKVKDMNPVILIAIGWSTIIPPQFLSIFKYAINCHGAILPDYRGNNVYMHSYANIEEEYGTTIHFMNEKFDDGNIILQAKAKLFLEETPLIIHRRISEMTAQILPQAIQLVLSGYQGKKQKGYARYFYKIDRMEMECVRQKNIENIRNGLEKEITKHKGWVLQ